jgi:hypothetical protein
LMVTVARLPLLLMLLTMVEELVVAGRVRV